MEFVQQVSCEYAGSSDVGEGEQTTSVQSPLPFLTNTQELRLYYWNNFRHRVTSPPKPTSLSHLLNIKQLTTLHVVPSHIDQPGAFALSKCIVN